MDCTKCPWKGDREACRICRQEQEVEERKRGAESQDWVKDVTELLEATLGVQAQIISPGKSPEDIPYLINPVKYTNNTYCHQN